MALTDSLPRLTLPGLSAASGLGVELARWRRRLLDCLPRGPRLWLASRHPELVIAPRGDTAEVFRDVIGERQLIGVIDRQAPDGAATLGAGGKQAWHHRTLELPAESLLIRRLILPAQVRDHLRQVLTYELDRLTPFSPEQVFFDARVTAVVAQGAKLEVELALCPRERASAWLESLRSAATPVTKLTWAGAWRDANLLPSEARPRHWRHLPWILTSLLVVLVIALLAAVLLTPLWQRRASNSA